MRYDIIVIGGGPAGLSAAVQARTRNKRVLVVGARPEDIPLWKAGQVDNYPGIPGVSGRELLERFEAHAAALGMERMYGRALNAMPAEDGFLVSVGSEVVEGEALILATGAAHGAKYPGEAEHLGMGVSYCATCDGMFYRGRDVVVAGQSAEAPEEANYLHGLGCKVTYVAKTRPETLDGAIPFRRGVKLEIVGEGSVLRPAGGRGGDPLRLRVSAASLRGARGAAARAGAPGRVYRGGPDMAASIPGVFAAGTAPGFPSRSPKRWAKASSQATGRRSIWIKSGSRVSTGEIVYQDPSTGRKEVQDMALYHFNQQGLEKAVSSGGLVMVDMWAPWCAPCRMLGPTVEKLAEQYDGKAVIGKLNTDENQQLAMQLGIMGIPCVIFFKDGREIDRKVGLMPAQAYTAVLDANL